jgi:Ca2+-binding RTX toxin-like protein
MMAVDSGALALGAYNATVTNAAGASITGIADAIGVIARPADRAGDGLRVVNHGLIRSLEEDAIDVDMLTLTNGATGVIDAAYGHVLARGSALATRNGNMIVDNAGIIRASDSAFAANQLLLTNSGTVIGRIDVGLYSRLENSGSITGAYHVWGGLTLINHSQSSGNLAIDVDPVAAQYSNGYTYTSIDNRGTFAGDITISGRTAFITAPAAHADYIALIVNSGTITGSIVSDAAFAPLAGGGSPDASFVEDVANSGTITGDVRLGDGADRLVNSGTIGGSVEGGGGDDQLRGGGAADRLDGGDGDDILEGGGHNDLLRSGAGKDRLDGGVGNDVLFYGATFDADDRADGGAGTDTLVLQGNYPALVLGALSAVGIEGISLQSGTIIRWGDAGESSYDYRLTLAQETAAPGQQLRINAQSLVAGEDLVLDGSAETDGGRLLVYGGFGADDLTGGAAGDIFYFESGRFGPGDRVRGGAGNDALVISGAPAGDGPLQLEIAEGVLSGIESLSFNGRFASDPDSLPSYEAVLRNGNIAPGATLIVNASSLAASQSLALDASTVADGILRIFGGAGGDSLTGGAKADRISAAGGDDLIVGGGLGDAIDGGAGADTFRYLSVADSAGAACDLISGFESGLDRIDLSAIDANLAADGNQAFAFVGTAAFSNKAGELRAAWDAATGSWAIQGDLNGDGRVDFQLYVATGGAAPLASDFVL